MSETGAQSSAPEVPLAALKILESVAVAAEGLLKSAFSDAAVLEMFERLGRAAAASRVYLFAHRRLDSGELVADQRVEWTDQGIEPQIDNPETQGWSYRGTDNEWLAERFEAGKTVAGCVGDFPPRYQELLRSQQIQSILCAPIQVAGRCWGFVGFDECRSERRWSDAEIGALRLGASLLGAAIERQGAEKSLRDGEERLRQATRMEAWGRFAGSVARDFDGLMTTIRNHGERIMSRLGATDPQRTDVAEMLIACERAAELTRDLMAFGRQQPARPLTLDPNRFLSQKISLLRRIVGEEIEVTFAEQLVVGTLVADPELLEQVLVTLFLDGREALGGKGRLELSLARVVAAELERRGAPGELHREYVRISIRDNRANFDSATAARLFEPFYSTEELGKGHGLGLSTVYGIVRQNDGFVFAASGAEAGAVFDLYLPSGDEPVDSGLDDDTISRLPPPHAAAQTVLLVEDEDLIRSLAEQILAERGYRILSAANASQAMEIAARAEGKIDLLLTDIVMPGASGSDLAQRLLRTHPQMRVLYMSGYSDSLIFRYGVLQERAAFLQKPFSADALERKVRELLAE